MGEKPLSQTVAREKKTLKEDETWIKTWIIRGTFLMKTSWVKKEKRRETESMEDREKMEDRQDGDQRGWRTEKK